MKHLCTIVKITIVEVRLCISRRFTSYFEQNTLSVTRVISVQTWASLAVAINRTLQNSAAKCFLCLQTTEEKDETS